MIDHLNRPIINILEIGTFDVFNALLLSNLFPNSNIDTMDLPEHEEDFINFYNRKDKVNAFLRDRNNTLSKNKNINFLPLNSLKLLNYTKKYDLIWIDGAHGYPTVCIDIINYNNTTRKAQTIFMAQGCILFFKLSWR